MYIFLNLIKSLLNKFKSGFNYVVNYIVYC